MFGCILHDQGVAKVGFVGSILCDRVGVPDARKRLRHGAASGKLLEDAAEHRLDSLEHVLLLNETHFHVELVELARRAIRARILIAEARCDLEIAVEARNHDELLELLGRLRKRIELSGVEAARHKEIARSFRRRSGEDRRLELEKSALLHPAPDEVDDLPAKNDIAMELVAPEI